MTFPYAALPAYWVFGRDKFQGYVLARREDIASIRDLARDTWQSVADVSIEEGPFDATVATAEKLARMPLTGGNEVELLIDGKATFASIFSGIDAAESYILVQFYIVRDDDLGREL